MMKPFLLSVALGAGSASSADTPSLFGSQEQAVSAISDLGPMWRGQIAPPKDFESPVNTSPALALVRQSPRKRRLFFAEGRSADLEWNREGNIDRILLYDPACWPTKREEAFAILLRHIQGDRRNLPLLVSAAKHVFDANHLPHIGIAVAPQRVINVGRTNKRYGCRIEIQLDSQRRI